LRKEYAAVAYLSIRNNHHPPPSPRQNQPQLTGPFPPAPFSPSPACVPVPATESGKRYAAQQHARCGASFVVNRRGFNRNAAGGDDAFGQLLEIEIASVHRLHVSADGAVGRFEQKDGLAGGIYPGGGILPKIWNETHHAIFNEYFFAVGRLHPLVGAVPVYLILNQKMALWGAGYYGAFG